MYQEGYPTRAEAERLLAEAVPLNPGPWAEHSKTAALCAERIAAACPDMDSEKAFVLGLLHDIGRRFGISNMGHIYHGWKYMLELGYPCAAQICLTHSYNTQRVEDDMGRHDIEPEQEAELREALAECTYDDYDRLIQLADALAGNGVVLDVEERMRDVRRRYGSYPEPKWKCNLELLRYFEEKTGRDIYAIVRG